MTIIVTLPTAAAAPVRQVRRQGRLPKAVRSLTRIRLQRRDEAARARAEAKVPDPDLVAGLTTLLRFAVAGEITGFVMSAHRCGRHDILSAGSYRADPLLAIAAATRMQQRFCTWVDEDEEA